MQGQRRASTRSAGSGSTTVPSSTRCSGYDSRVGGWLLVLYTTIVVGAACALTLLQDGAGLEGAGAVIRLTARTSLVLFGLAFAARATSQLFGVKWLLKNRRYLGVSFAVSHGYHLAGIIAVAVMIGWTRFVESVGMTGLFGAVGYLFIFAMVATSFDRTTAWLGRRRWKLLHTTGMYVVASFFVVTYAGAVAQSPSPLYVLLAVLSLAPLVLRLVAQASRRQT